MSDDSWCSEEEINSEIYNYYHLLFKKRYTYHTI